MSESIIRFPHHSRVGRDNNPEAANHARERIAKLPSSYLAHAAPVKEDLVGAVHPVSPAAEAEVKAETAPPKPEAPVAAAVAAPMPEPAPNPVAAVVGATPLSSVPAAEAPAEIPKEEKTTPPPKEPGKKRRVPAQLMPLLTGVVTFVALAALFKAPIFLSQFNYASKPSTAEEPKEAKPAVGAAPVISIPKINVNAPVVYAQSNVEAAIQKDLESGVVHYANTAKPGDPGNSVIFGHSSNDWWEPGNYKFVFVLLDKLQPGDTFTVNYNSKQFLYQVTGSKVVEPTDISVLAQTPDPTMTLITCTPPGTSWKRLVVNAKQVNPAPSVAAAPTPANDPSLKSLSGNGNGVTDKIGNFWQTLVSVFKD